MLVNNVGMSYPHAEYYDAIDEQLIDDLITMNIVSTNKAGCGCNAPQTQCCMLFMLLKCLLPAWLHCHGLLLRAVLCAAGARVASHITWLCLHAVFLNPVHCPYTCVCLGLIASSFVRR